MPTLRNEGFGQGISPYQRMVGLSLIPREMLGSAPTAAGGSRLYGFLLLASFLAWFAPAGRDKRIAVAFACTGAILVFAAFTFGYVQAMAVLQPNRFSAAGWLMMSVPAALGIKHGVGRALEVGSIRRAAWALPLAFIFMGTAFFVRELVREVFIDSAPKYGMSRPEVNGMGPTTMWLLGALRKIGADDTRVFFETSEGRVIDDGHVVGLLALSTGREFIGGAYPFMHFAGAWDDWAFGRSMTGFPPSELDAYLNLYDIGWMVCHTGGCRQAFRRLPSVERIADFGPLTLFRRVSEGSCAIGTRCRVVSRRINRIELELTPANHPVTLRYHWLPGIETAPGVPMHPTKRLEDPVPFITIDVPVQHLVLKMR